MAAAGVVLVVGVALHNNDNWNSTHPPPSPSAERAGFLRHEAGEACAKAQWRTCLDRLDDADRRDPAGADDPKVKALRKEAEEGSGLRR